MYFIYSKVYDLKSFLETTNKSRTSSSSEPLIRLILNWLLEYKRGYALCSQKLVKMLICSVSFLI